MKIISAFAFNNFKYFVSEVADRSPQYEILSKEQVISLINIGSIKMNGLTANDGKLMIYGEEVKDMVPNLKNGKKTTTERYALAVDVTDGNPVVIYCDFVGRVKTESLAEAYDNQNKYTNIVFTKFIDGDYPSVQINKSIYVPTIKNSEGTRLFMPTTFGLKAVDNEIIESLKHETLSLENWLRTVYRCGYDVSVSYSRTTMSVTALDSRITEMTFPKELSSLKLNENLDKIVVSNGTYMSMTGKAKKELQIVYESDSVDSFDVTGLLNVDTDSVIRGIPKTNRLYNLLNFLTDGNSDIKVLNGYNVDLSDKEINVFCQSLRAVGVNSLTLPNSTEISSCCYRVKVNNTIEIPSTIRDISYSFDNMSIESVTDGMYIDFSNATSLEKIDRSFNNISNEVIDLSNCTNLRSISDCFKGCKNLKRVILPDTLESVYGATFVLSSNIEYINIPKNIKLFNFSFDRPQMYSKIELENIERFTPHITNEVVVKNLEVLTGSLYRGLAYSGIENVSYGNIVKIEPWAFTRYSLDNFKFADIHVLSTGCFSESTGELLDLYNTSIKVINEHVFSKSRINCIILPKGTSQIRENAFKDIEDVNKLFIPSGAKLDDNAIKLNRHSNTVTVFYVVKDSDAENYCKKNKFNYRSFSSDDEAYASISGKLNELSDTNKNKIKLFYSGTKDIFTKELTDDKYIGHALELTNINKLIDSNCVLEFPQIKLDMRKIKPLYKASELRSLLLDYNVEYASEQELLAAYCPNESALPNEFKSICNMITNCARNWNSSLMSLANLKKIFDKAVEIRKGVTLDIHNIIYTKDYQISVITVRVKDEYSNYIIISFYFVRISGNIVFAAFTDDDAYCNIYDIFKKYNIGAKKERIKVIKELAAESNDASESLLKNVGNIDNILNVNDVLLPGGYGANSDISGVQITNLMNTRLYEIYKYQLLPIALNSSPTKLNREAILLNIYTGTVYKVQFKNDTAIYPHDLYKYGISLINKWGINDIDYEDISKLTMKDTDSNRVINEIIVGNTFDPELITRPNAYDKIEPCFEYKLSQYYIKNNVRTIDDLELHDSISSKQLDLIFSTAYFTKESTKSNFKICSRREFCFVDGTNKLIQANIQNRKTANIIGAQCEYVYYIQNQYGEVVDDALYLSSVGIREVVRQISGIAVNAESADKYGFITGKAISTSSFTAIKAIVLRGTNSIRLSIHKGNGVPYIIYGDSSHSIPIFRFRNLNDAAEFCKNLTLNKSVKYNGKVASQYPASDLAYFVDYLDGQYNKKPVSPYSKIYDYMINGFPNGYEPLGAEGNLFKLLAKQPK